MDAIGIIVVVVMIVVGFVGLGACIRYAIKEVYKNLE